MKESVFPLDQQLLVILGVTWGAGEGEAAGLSLYDAHLGNTCDLNILMFWWGWLSGEARIQEEYLLCAESPCPTQPPSQVCHKTPWAWMVK